MTWLNLWQLLTTLSLIIFIGVLFYDGMSTGKVSSTSQSDGWEFKDSSTGKFVRVSGACLVEN